MARTHDRSTAIPPGTTAIPRRTTAIPRRTMLAGAGATVLALAACTEDQPIGMQSPTASPPSVQLTEFAGAHGDHTVWQVVYDLEEDEEAPETYDATVQEARHEALQAKRQEQDWTASDPLLVLDPYGTTRTGLYVHFTDPAAGQLSFTVSATAAADFAQTAANHSEAGTGFEGLVIGLIPGAHNDVTLTWTADGAEPASRTVRIKAPATSEVYATQLSTEIGDQAAVSPGLFALSGVSGDSNNTYLFDGAGVMRGEFLSTDHPSHNFGVEDGRMVISTGARQLSVLDPLGHATSIIDLGSHMVHHDLDVVGDVAYVLTSEAESERVEDRVIRVDLESGEVAQCVDLQTMLPAYEELAHAQSGEAGGTTATGKDWIHINSVQVADGVMYLSARETSTVLALDGALEADSEPSVRWLIGVQELWNGTGYEDHFLAPEGSPTGNAGQHTAYRMDDDALPEGQYYLEMYNNNMWRLETRDAEVWEDVGPPEAVPDGEEGISHVLRYVVDETARTFHEDFRVDVAYSSVVSGVQRLGGGTIDDPFVVNSGMANVFTEHTADGTVLATYRYDSPSFGYRVYKDSFEGFWFSGG